MRLTLMFPWEVRHSFDATGNRPARAGRRGRAVTANAAVRAAALASVDTLEGRTLLSGATDAPAFTAAVAAPDVTARGGATASVTVRYHADAGVDLTTIDVTDLTVGPTAATATATATAAAPLAVQGVAVDATDPSNVVATYTVGAAGGTWGDEDNGGYAAAVQAGAVADAAGNPVAAASATFQVRVPAAAAADTTGPAADIAVADVTAAGAAAQSFTVTFTDDVGVDATSIDAGDVAVTAPGGATLPVKLGAVKPSADGKSVVATFALDAPGGAWDVADNGTYTIAVKAGGVTDVAGNGVAAGSKAFRVDVPAPPPPADTVGPTATLASTPAILTASGATQAVVVTYADDVGVDASTIGVDDVEVTLGGKKLDVTGVTATGDGKAVVATYTVAAPGDAWDVADDGHYAVSVKAGAVTDSAGNASTAAAGSFDVSLPLPIPLPTDPAPLTVKITQPDDVTAAGGSGVTITVTYRGDGSTDPGVADAKNLTVSHKGDKPLKVTGAQTRPTADGNGTVATYTVAAPGGSWDDSDNGTYSVKVKGGKHGGAASSAFDVNVAPAAPVVPPLATISPIDSITVAGAGGDGTLAITVTYSDDAAVSVDSIGTDDLTVVGPGGRALAVTDVTVRPRHDDARVTATYTVAAPAGGWAVADNGTYAVTVLAGRVADTSGATNAAANATFAVAVPAPKPPIDAGFSGGQPVSAAFVGEGAATQADGRIVVVGRVGDPAAGPSQLVLKRLNADGSPDGTFGDGGSITGPAGGRDAAYAVALADDGGILVAGTHDGDFALLKFKADGTPDVHFGDHGRVVTDLGAADDTAYALAVAPDGSIVAAGGAGGRFAFARYFANGAAVANFGQGGVAHSDAGNVVGAVAVAADGSIVGVGGRADNAVAVVRLTPGGAGDASFGDGGAAVLPGFTTRTDLGGPDHTEGLALQGDRVLVANRAGNDFALARLDAAGRPDGTFGSGGVITTDFGGDDDADLVALQGSGEILVLGTTDAGNAPRAAVAAYTADGQLDAAFGDGGRFTLDAGGGASPTRALHVGTLLLRAFGGVQADGKLVVGTSDQTPAAAAAPQSSSTGLRRLNVPGSGLLGDFGAVKGRNKRLTFLDENKTRVTLTLRGGGSGKAYYDGTNVDLVLTGTTARTSLLVRCAGGNGYVTLRNVQSDGAIGVVSAGAASLTGTLAAASLGRVALGSVGGGTICSAGSIGSLAVAGDLVGAKVLAGADTGSDGKFGGAVADVYRPASIGKVWVGGAARQSVVAAGLDPVNGILLDSDDALVGGTGSAIGSIVVRKTVDDATRFVAGAIGKARLPGAVDPRADVHCRIMT